MDLQQLPSYLCDLFTEVALMDEEAFPPNDPVAPGETVIGEVVDRFARQMWAFGMFNRREADMFRVQCHYTAHKENENCEHARGVNVHEYKAKILQSLFFAQMNEQFSLWGSGLAMGVRAGWKIVKCRREGGMAIDASSLPPNLRKLLEGLLGGGPVED